MVPDVSSLGYRMEPASVSTNTSCSRPRSRAEGVRIVLGPTKIFSLRVIARRTSFSLTNGEIVTAGAGGGAGFGVGTGGAATGEVWKRRGEDQ